jgi:hypothetical protein
MDGVYKIVGNENSGGSERIRIRIWIRTQETQKHTDQDPQHCFLIGNARRIVRCASPL